MDDREKLYPTCGKLYPDGLSRLAKCEDYEQVKAVADCYPVRHTLPSPPHSLPPSFLILPPGVCRHLPGRRDQPWGEDFGRQVL